MTGFAIINLFSKLTLKKLRKDIPQVLRWCTTWKRKQKEQQKKNSNG